MYIVSKSSFFAPFLFFFSPHWLPYPCQLSNWTRLQMVPPPEHSCIIQQRTAARCHQGWNHTIPELSLVTQKIILRKSYQDPAILSVTKRRALYHHHRGHVIAGCICDALWQKQRGEQAAPRGAPAPRAPPWREHSLRTQPALSTALGVTSPAHVYWALCITVRWKTSSCSALRFFRGLEMARTLGKQAQEC